MASENFDLEKLITLIQQRPSIYNYKDKQHSNRDVQEKLWTEISNIMKAPASECKSKWTTLRNSYSRQLREEKKIPSGSGASKKRKWYLYDTMGFLRDFMMQHKKMSSNFVGDNLDESMHTNLEESVIPDSEEEQDEFNPDVVKVGEKEDKEKELNISSSPVFVKPKKRKILASDMVAEPMINYLKSKTNAKMSNEDPPELLFFKSIIPDFKKLTDKNQRKFKNIVLSTLDQFLDEQETSLTSSMYSNNLLPLFSNNLSETSTNQNTVQSQSLNQNLLQATQFLYTASPDLSSSESTSSYQ